MTVADLAPHLFAFVLGFLFVGLLCMSSWHALGAPAVERRRTASAKATAAEMLKKVRKDSDTAAFKWLRAAGWAVSPFALPVGGAAVVAGLVARSVSEGLKLRRERMPESWYHQVLGDSSEEGRLYLGARLKRQGHITVPQAARWLEIETQESARPATANPAIAALVAEHDARPTLAARLRGLAHRARRLAQDT